VSRRPLASVYDHGANPSYSDALVPTQRLRAGQEDRQALERINQDIERDENLKINMKPRPYVSTSILQSMLWGEDSTHGAKGRRELLSGLHEWNKVLLYRLVILVSKDRATLSGS